MATYKIEQKSTSSAKTIRVFSVEGSTPSFSPEARPSFHQKQGFLLIRSKVLFCRHRRGSGARNLLPLLSQPLPLLNQPYDAHFLP